MRGALPARFYGDPANVCDELRRLSDFAEVLRQREIVRKQRRIKSLVKAAKAGKGRAR
jgi:hypothetical protein